LSKAAGETWVPLRLRGIRDGEGNIEVILMAPPKPQASRSADRSVVVNDRPLQVAHALCDGDELAVGGWRLRYENLAQAARRRSRHTRPNLFFPTYR
jgi:hypothetical protein